MKGTLRNGTHGVIGLLDANGFAVFIADNGATFTVHNAEFIADDATPEQKREAQKRWASWPDGPVTITVERGKHSNAPTLIVKRSASA